MACYEYNGIKYKEEELRNLLSPKPTKTRRILEIQSDLFQKGRDKEHLSSAMSRGKLNYDTGNISFEHEGYIYVRNDDGMFKGTKMKPYEYQLKQKEFEDILEQYLIPYSEVDRNNQFLQLLNKDNNWVTFFIKSIIQDSAKKGYEKVLFPTGNTASKVEGHTTLEEFKKQKEDRIKELENRIASDETIININDIPIKKFEILDNKGKTIGFRKLDNGWNIQYMTGEKAFQEQLATDEQVLKGINKIITNRKEKDSNEITQLKQELEGVETEGFGALRPIYDFYENTVTNILNKTYGKNNVKEITDEYGNKWNEVEIKSEYSSKILLQKSTSNVEISPKTIKLVKDLIERMGVRYDGGVNNIIVNGEKIDANGIANIMKGYIEVINGKESEALPEEAMHFAVEIMEQKNPKLFNQMLKEISNFIVYKEVLADYSNDSNYQTKEGKPDIRKLKKEAIAKQLVNTIINKMEGSETYQNIAKAQTWWSKILEYIKNLFAQSGFDQAAMDIISGKEIGTIADIRGSTSGAFLQIDKQSKIYNDLKETSNKIVTNDKGYAVDGKQTLRVTEIIKTWAQAMFDDRKLTQDEFDRLVDQLKQEKGTAGHADIEHAFSLYVDEEGYLREESDILDDSTYVSQLNPEDRKMYKLLRDNLKERLESYEAGTRFMSEITVYNPQRNLAGTIDFLAITPEGKVHILDWKFMALNDSYDDVPWYSVRSWNDQMTQYKLILERAYNVNIKDFGQTRMIPIKAKYSKGSKKKNILPKLLSIKIGDVDVKNIEQDYLLPVPLQGEKTGNKKIDTLLDKLNALYKQFSDTTVIPSKRLEKAGQLNALFTAIRRLHLKQDIDPLIYQAKVLNKQLKDIIEKFNNEWSTVDAAAENRLNPKEFQKKISEFQIETDAGLNAIRYYTTLDTDLKELTKDDTELKQDLRDTVDNARELQSELENISEKFADKIIAGSEEVKGSILDPEKTIKNISKWFVSTSNIQMKSMDVLFKKANRQLGFAAKDTLDEIRILKTLEENYKTWANAKGLNIKTNYFDSIKKKDKNELIDEYQPEFYKELKSKIANKDYKWIQENIDIAEYKKYVKDKIEEGTTYIDNKYRIGTEDEIKKQIIFETNKLKALYDISTPTSVGWLKKLEIRRFPAKKWETAEWKELHKEQNKPALDFFNYIKDKNEAYRKLGYIHDKNSRVFLPFVRKGVMEKVVLGGDIKFGEHFLRSISIDEGDIGYGAVDPLTKEVISKIPKYFTRDVDGELSSDLFRTMALYNEAAIRYKYLSDIEAQARGLVRIEKNKESILTSSFNNTIYKNGELQYSPNNNENTKLLDDMVKGIIYGQKYIQSESFDQKIGKLGELGKKLNEKLGVNIFPENIENREVSVNKLLTQLNTTFQLNAMGLNPLSALSNLLGGSFNSIINSGTYFTKNDFMGAETQLLVNKFNGQDAKKMIGLLEYFLPLTDNYNQQLAKDLSLSKFSQENLQEFLMVLMRKSDWFVQTANFYAYIKNSIVQDGQIVNARVYLRNTPEYKDQMFAGTKADRKAIKAKFEQDVQDLIKEKGVEKHSKIVNNQLVIEGVDKNDLSVLDVRKKVQFLNKSALGNLSEDDLRTINMNIYGKSFMLFKNWIPRLVDVRMGNLKYNSASDAYEWGRMRMIFRLLATDFLGTLDAFQDSLIGSGEKWIIQARKLYEIKKAEYKKDTNKDLEMTEDEFIELVLRNRRNALKDLLIMASLFSTFTALGYAMPDDEEDPGVKNMYGYLLRATDKVKDELWFFYDPTSLTSLVGGGIFPSLSYINTLKKAISKTGRELYGLSIGDDKFVEDNDVIKYIMKSFPISAQGTQILPLFYPELAKDLGLRTTTQSRPIGF